MTTLSYHTPEDIQLSLEGVDQAKISLSSAEGSILAYSERGLTMVTGRADDETVKLEINFDPPKTPIRITSPDQIPILAGSRRNYAITTDILSRFLRHKNEGLLQEGKTITKLFLNKVCFSDPDDGIWASATRELVHLQHVTATTCAMDPNLWLDQLAYLPSLRSLEFCHVVSQPDRESVSLVNVTRFLRQRKETLVDLKFWGLNHHSWSDERVGDFFDSVRECTALKVLHCNIGDLTEKQVELLGNMIRGNPRLQELKINVHPQNSTMPIAQSLAQNQSLQSLEIMAESRTIKNCVIECLSEYQAFLDTVATQNVHLSHLKLDCYTLLAMAMDQLADTVDDEAFKKTILDAQQARASVDFYLELNGLGRRRFLRGSVSNGEDITKSKEDWVEMIASNRDNLSVIFYFLLLDPSIYFGRF